MVDAGIQTPDAVIRDFKEMQLGNKLHWVIYKIANKREVQTLSKWGTGANEEWDWDTFCEQLMGDSNKVEPRFATVDFHFEGKDGRDQTKLLFVSWTPENSRPGDKMLYASTKEGFKSKLDGVQKVLQATDESELDYDHVKDTVESL